jgi:site-specific DNA-methyltransferase (adenine-specific)
MIYHGDCRELIKGIEPQSVDLIFTDPPYMKEYLYLYEWLADISNAVLKPTGFVAMYVGCYHLANVMRLIDGKLDFFIECVIFGSGNGSIIWPRRTIAKHKSLLIYRPTESASMPRCNMTSVFNGTGEDKRYHAWGQDEASARYYIDCLTKKGDMVLDPFCGGGTTPAMCKVLERECISYEIDEGTYKKAVKRVDQQQMPLSNVFLSNPSIENEVLL